MWGFDTNDVHEKNIAFTFLFRSPIKKFVLAVSLIHRISKVLLLG
jgi:hypothetical protein